MRISDIKRAFHYWRQLWGLTYNPDSHHIVPVQQFDSDLTSLLRRHERAVPHMYLDSGNNVTVGVGHLCPTSAEACRLPFVYLQFERPASSNEIAFGWASLKYQQAGTPKKLTVYKPLLMEDFAINAVLLSDCSRFLAEAYNCFPEFDSYPHPARLAVMDMLFNLGSLREFPRFRAAVIANDWLTAAAECHRAGIGAERNLETFNLLTEAGKV